MSHCIRPMKFAFKLLFALQLPFIVGACLAAGCTNDSPAPTPGGQSGGIEIARCGPEVSCASLRGECDLLVGTFGGPPAQTCENDEQSCLEENGEGPILCPDGGM